jgi:hypothetical protein
MSDKMYWAARCKSCSGMVGYRDVKYTLDVYGANVEEKLPEGTTKRRCDHCGSVGDFNMRQLRPTSVRLLIPRMPQKQPASLLLLLEPNHTHRNRPPFPFWKLQACLFRCCFRLERLR